MRSIRIVNRTGKVHDTEVIDIATGKNLTRKYAISSVKLVLDVDDPLLSVKAVVEFCDIEVDCVSEEVETNHQIIKGAL